MLMFALLSASAPQGCCTTVETAEATVPHTFVSTSEAALKSRIDTMADWYTNAVEKFLDLYHKKKEDPQVWLFFSPHFFNLLR